MPQSEGLSSPLEPCGARKCRKLSPLSPHPAAPSPQPMLGWGAGSAVSPAARQLLPGGPCSWQGRYWALPWGSPGWSVSRVEFQPFRLGERLTGAALGKGPIIAPLPEDVAGVIRF